MAYQPVPSTNRKITKRSLNNSLAKLADWTEQPRMKLVLCAPQKMVYRLEIKQISFNGRTAYVNGKTPRRGKTPHQDISELGFVSG